MTSMINTYLNRKRRDRSENTVISTKNSLQQFFRWKLKNDMLTVDDVSDSDVVGVKGEDVEYYKDYMYNVYSTSGANTKLRYLKTFFKWVNDSGFMRENVFVNVTYFNEPERKPISMSFDEVQVVLDYIATLGTRPSKRDYTILAIILSSGLRISEALSLKPNMIIRSIDGDEVIYSLDVIGKRDKERTTIITENAYDLLHKYIMKHDIEDNEKVFKVTPRTIERNMKGYIAKASLSSKYTPHKLRHTFATLLYESGVQIEEIGNYLGHTNSNTTRKFYVEMGQKNRTQATKIHPVNGINLKGI